MVGHVSKSRKKRHNRGYYYRIEYVQEEKNWRKIVIIIFINMLFCCSKDLSH